MLPEGCLQLERGRRKILHETFLAVNAVLLAVFSRWDGRNGPGLAYKRQEAQEGGKTVVF